MGGNAFPTPAKRLSSADHAALQAYCLARLPFSPMSIPIYFSSKASHGDVDILCGWTGIGFENAKGQSAGVAAATPATVDTNEAHLVDVDISSSPATIDRWCADLAHKVGGTRWLRNGSEVSIAVPIGVVESDKIDAPSAVEPDAQHANPVEPETAITAATPTDDFYQVDLLLLPPESVPFVEFAYSYGTVLYLLGHMARYATTDSVIVHTHCVILRSRPYARKPPIDVVLSCEARAVCEWLGIDYDAWLRARFDNVEELFAWFASVRPGSIGEPALRRFAEYGMDGKPRSNRASAAVAEFGAWLRAHGWDVAADGDVQSPTTTKKPILSSQMTDPDDPTPLMDAEIDVLNYWGKLAEYNAKVETVREELKEEREIVLRNRRRKLAERQATAQLAEDEKDKPIDWVEKEMELAVVQRAEIDRVLSEHSEHEIGQAKLAKPGEQTDVNHGVDNLFTPDGLSMASVADNLAKERDQIAKDKAELETARRELGAREAEFAAAKRELESHQTKLTAATRFLETREAELAAAKLDVDASKTDHEVPKNGLESSISKLDVAKRDLETSKSEHEAAQRSLDVSQTEYMAAKAKLDHDLRTLAEEREQIRIKYEELVYKNEVAIKTNDEQIAKHKFLIEGNEELNQRHDALAAAQQELRVASENNIANREEVAREMEVVAAERAELEIEKTLLREEVEAFDKVRSLYEKAVEKEKAAAEEDATAFDTEKQANALELSRTREAVENARSALEEDRKALEKEKEALEKDKEALEQQEESLANKTNEVQRKRDVLDGEKSHLDSEKDALLHEKEQFSREKKELERQRGELDRMKEELHHEQDNLKAAEQLLKVMEGELSEKTAAFEAAETAAAATAVSESDDDEEIKAPASRCIIA